LCHVASNVLRERAFALGLAIDAIMRDPEDF
jgi:hypothetical protein